MQEKNKNQITDVNYQELLDEFQQFKYLFRFKVDSSNIEKILEEELDLKNQQIQKIYQENSSLNQKLHQYVSEVQQLRISQNIDKVHKLIQEYINNLNKNIKKLEQEIIGLEKQNDDLQNQIRFSQQIITDQKEKYDQIYEQHIIISQQYETFLEKEQKKIQENYRLFKDQMNAQQLIEFEKNKDIRQYLVQKINQLIQEKEVLQTQIHLEQQYFMDYIHKENNNLIRKKSIFQSIFKNSYQENEQESFLMNSQKNTNLLIKEVQQIPRKQSFFQIIFGTNQN